MSIYYYINEHLVVEDSRNHPELTKLAAEQIRTLANSMKYKKMNISVSHLDITVDGETYSFSGEKPTKELRQMIRRIPKATSLEICANYGYMHYAMNPDIHGSVHEHVAMLADNDSEKLDCIFYSLYNEADCSDSIGTLCAYGNRNGRFYNGIVPERVVDHLPDGAWRTPLTAVVYDSDESDQQDWDAIEDVCRKMCAFSCYDSLDRDERGVTFFLNNLELKNDEELQKFLDLCNELTRLTDGECGIIIEMTDWSGSDARTMTVDVYNPNGVKIQLSAIDD